MPEDIYSPNFQSEFQIVQKKYIHDYPDPEEYFDYVEQEGREEAQPRNE